MGEWGIGTTKGEDYTHSLLRTREKRALRLPAMFASRGFAEARRQQRQAFGRPEDVEEYLQGFSLERDVAMLEASECSCRGSGVPSRSI